jgi:transcriptional regulator with XRE-family HTH domain
MTREREPGQDEAAGNLTPKLGAVARQLTPEVREQLHYEMVEAAVRDQLLRLRKQSGLSQKQVAERLGVTQAAVSKLESNKSGDFRFRAVMNYVLAFGGSIEVIVRDEQGRNMLNPRKLERALDDAAATIDFFYSDAGVELLAGTTEAAQQDKLLTELKASGRWPKDFSGLKDADTPTVVAVLRTVREKALGPGFVLRRMLRQFTAKIDASRRSELPSDQRTDTKPE